MKDNNEILLAENISKSFGVTKACKNISLSIACGEIHGIIGENGSGKSTFVSMLSGVYPKDNGKFILNGHEYSAHTQFDANEKGVSIIVQEMGTLNGLTVAQNIFLGKEDKFTKAGLLNKRKLNKKANEILKSFSFDFIRAGDMIDNYNFETKKLVEIVKATYFDPKILIVDETTTALSREGRDILYNQIKKIRDDGRTVIFISHDLVEVLEITDRISVFRDGEYIDTVISTHVNEDDLKRLMVGREMEKRYYRTDYNEPISDEIVMRAKNISIKDTIYDISFNLHKGEILGIGGLSDCGMHDLAKALFGAAYYRKGTVTLADNTEINSIQKAIKHDIAYTSKDRDNESLLINSSIKDNICLISLDKLNGKFGISNKKEKKFAQEYADMMSIKMQDIDQFVSNLSGGNKQKVVLARWIGKNSNILVLDSPTRGIDIKVKADVYSLMDHLRRQGKSIVMISEEIMELIGMCDRILILKNGEISGEFDRRKDLVEQDLIMKMV